MSIVVCTWKFVHRSVNHSKAQVRHALTLTNPVKILQYNSQIRNYCITHWPNTTLSRDPNEPLTDLLHDMNTSAAWKVGELKRRNSAQHIAGPKVTELSEHQRAPRLKIYQHSTSKDRATLHKGRANIFRLISRRLKDVAVEEADTLADQITSTDDYRKAAPFKQRTLRPSLSKTPMTTSWDWTKSKQEPDDINSELFNHFYWCTGFTVQQIEESCVKFVAQGP